MPSAFSAGRGLKSCVTCVIVQQTARISEAGSKYLSHLIGTYFDDPEIDDVNRLLFAFAGYNAGPNRVNRLRKEAPAQGLDPNVWFRNVELLVARDVGREPVQYVSNIFKYYVAYKMMADREQARPAS
jgi:membrane-bound lytic murein transglycosylase MltF